MRTTLSRILFALLLVSPLVLGSCSSKEEEKAPAPSQVDPLDAAPHAPLPGDPGLITLTLTGGRFGTEGRKLVYPIRKKSAISKITRTPGGMRITVSPPSYKNSLSTPQWGLWLFLEGKVREDRPLRTLTGTQIMVDGTPFAPAAAKTGKARPSSPALQGTLLVEIIDPTQKNLEGIFEGVFLPPEGGEEITVQGSVKIPWPPAS